MDRTFKDGYLNWLRLKTPQPGTAQQYDAMGQAEAAAEPIDPTAIDKNGFIDMIATMESGGERDPSRAKNQASTAAGAYQITKPTWDSMAQFDDDLPPYEEMIGNMDAQKKGMSALFDANHATLSKTLGRPPALEDLTLAHRFGAGAAKRIVDAPSIAKLSAILPSRVLSANPELGKKYKNIGELRDDIFNTVAMFQRKRGKVSD